jgi:hypothetical protein
VKYAVEMGPDTTIYVPTFIKIGSGIQNLLGGIYIQTHRQQDDLISLYFFSLALQPQFGPWPTS